MCQERVILTVILLHMEINFHSAIVQLFIDFFHGMLCLVYIYVYILTLYGRLGGILKML